MPAHQQADRDVRDLVNRHLDEDFVVRTLQALAHVPTEVPVGYDTLIDGDDPLLVHYVHNVVLPRVRDVAPDVVCRDVGGNLLIRDGDAGTADSVLLQTYSVTQHHNLMDDPLSGRIEERAGRRVVLGQGVSQVKAHQAVMLGVLKLFRDAGATPRRTVWWTVNNEGRSSHACTGALLDAMGETPAYALLLVDEDMRLSVGNRGRVDIDVTIEGTPAHSSAPHLARDPIGAVADVVARLRTLTWSDVHPRLGGRHAIVYKVRYEPLAPHTIPARAELTIDRRLLPGDEPAAAVQEIRDLLDGLGPCTIRVHDGVAMLPVLVDDGEPVVPAVQRAITAVRGERAREIVGQGTFDAGGTAQRGIPTVMWGAGGAGDWPLGEDFVAIDDVLDEVCAVAHLLLGENP
jgi:acetylornithine deacetylase/succinyl-diaminopimelate desuccinylase-like protein